MEVSQGNAGLSYVSHLETIDSPVTHIAEPGITPTHFHLSFCVLWGREARTGYLLFQSPLLVLVRSQRCGWYSKMQRCNNGVPEPLVEQYQQRDAGIG